MAGSYPPDFDADEREQRTDELLEELGAGGAMFSDAERKAIGLHRSILASQRERAAKAQSRDDRACDRCDHYCAAQGLMASSEGERYDRRGECRIDAPQVPERSERGGGGWLRNRRFPIMYAHDWCGDYKPDTRPSTDP